MYAWEASIRISKRASKRIKRADTTPNPDGSGLKKESANDIAATVSNTYPELISMFNVVKSWLSLNSVFKHFFDNDEWAGLLLERLQFDLGKKHDLVAVLVENDTKNHLMWDFRRWAVRKVGTSGTALKEREFTTIVINEDANNYHAWSQRQWVLRTFGGDRKDELWADELAYCGKIIEEDPFNSFAWDQRYFVVTRCLVEIDEGRARKDKRRGKKAAKKVERYFDKKRSKEVDFAINFIEADPGNRCPWTHIRGLYTAYCGSMTFDIRVREAILRVLEGEVNRLKVHGGKMDDGFVSLMNARGTINALNALLDLLGHGFYRTINKEPGKKLRDAINALWPDPIPDYLSHRGVLGKIFLILKRVEKNCTACGLAWRNVGASVFALGVSYVGRALADME